MLLTLAIVLLVGAMVFLFLEPFVPSMGILTACGLACSVGSSWAAFSLGAGTGWLFVTLNAVGLVAALVTAFKILPRSPMALGKTSVEEGGYVPVEKAGDLVGRSGVAFTVLRPGGTALIEGRKVDVVAAGGCIEQDARVRVVAVEGFKVVVEKETL